APVLLVWTARRGWRGLAAYRWLYGIVAVGFLLVLAVQLGRGRSLTDLLGAYKVTSQERYGAGCVARWALYHVAELDLYVGVAPFAALLLLALVARRLARPVQALVAASVALTVWLMLEVAAFASLPSVDRVEERYVFYLAPLFLISLLVVV